MATGTKRRRAHLHMLVKILDVLDALERPATTRELLLRLGNAAPSDASLRHALAELVATGEVARTKRPGHFARFRT